MKAILITQELKDKNKLFDKKDVGAYHIGNLPNQFWGIERIIGGYAGRTDLQAVDGWLDFIQPTYNTETHYQINDVIKSGETYTYQTIAYTQTELDARLLEKNKIAKEQEAEKIKQEKLDKYTESVLTPTERLAFYPDYVVGQVYQIPERVAYKLKTFENQTADNSNAPDKGGWLEIK